jgi:EAL domain-containing protein (putative c-di-GMP-specific phosphodiesterase class I)
MNFDAVKFDGSLVVGLAANPRRQKLLEGLIALCNSLGVISTAEHVTSIEELALLQTLGCDNVQGYLIGRPTTLNPTVLHKMVTESRAA